MAKWEPLFSVFRHYVGHGVELGRTFRATTAATRDIACGFAAEEVV